MKESSFVKIFQNAGKDVFGDKLIVKKGAPLLYELTLNRALELAVRNTKSPKRGQSAFQTDICVFERMGHVEYPPVIIEFKTQITTHDVITYSSKAGKHKKIYPGLRYGLLASEIETIPDRFFVHNENNDFFIAAKHYKNNARLNRLIKDLIETEVQTSRTLEDIYFNSKNFDYYRTSIVFKDFDDIGGSG